MISPILHCASPYCCVCVTRFSYLFESHSYREGGGRTEWSRDLPAAGSLPRGLGWAELGAFSCLPCGQQVAKHWGYLAMLFLSPLAGHWIGSRAGGTWISTQWYLHTLCHNASLRKCLLLKHFDNFLALEERHHRRNRISDLFSWDKSLWWIWKLTLHLSFDFP